MITNLTEKDFYSNKDIYKLEIDKGTIYNSKTEENICDVYYDEQSLFLLKLLNTYGQTNIR